jgi:hypothetical protein
MYPHTVPRAHNLRTCSCIDVYRHALVATHTCDREHNDCDIRNTCRRADCNKVTSCVYSHAATDQIANRCLCATQHSQIDAGTADPLQCRGMPPFICLKCALRVERHVCSLCSRAHHDSSQLHVRTTCAICTTHVDVVGDAASLSQ